MAITSKRARLMTIQELLTPQRTTEPVRCNHCDRDASDRDHELVERALRVRIRVLETRLAEIEAKVTARP
jgi:hypothetical protein